MTARDVSPRLLLAVALAAVGCYDVPKPACGFRCGPDLACPDDYTCASDGRCHLNGASPSLVCPTPDAGAPDAYSPAVVGSQPGPGGTIDPSSPVRVLFDVDVSGVSTMSFTVAIAGAATNVPGNVTYDPATWSATFSTPEGLPPNQMLEATLTSNIFVPATGQPLLPTTIGFRTSADTTRPTVLFTSPSNGAGGASVGTMVTFRFSEPVVNTSTATITLTESTAITDLPGTVTYDIVSRTATFTPQDQLTPNLGYTARLTGITDASGNALDPDPAFVVFSTGPDTVAPSVRVTSPVTAATNIAVGANIVVTFDEPVTNVTSSTFQVNGGAVAGTITMSNGGRTVTFDPTADLPAASSIVVMLSNAIEDTSGNALSPFAYAFTTM